MKNGFFLVDKPAGGSSLSVDKTIKKRFDLPKAGHLGTLDPFASGLLLVGINQTTKAMGYVKEEEKEYEATLVLGEETDTLDGTGKVTRTVKVPDLTSEAIEKVLSSFLGKQSQIPPIFSAKHIEGKRAYDLARSGHDLSLPPIAIDVEDIRLLSYSEDTHSLSFFARVSKGTYLRALGRDIASRLLTCGYLSALRRTAIGPFSLREAVAPEKLSLADLHPLLDLFRGYQRFVLSGKEAFQAANGVPLKLKCQEESLLLLNEENKPLALYQKAGDLYRCKKGFSR